MKKIYLLLLVTIMISSGVNAQIVFVPGDYPNIQDAVDNVNNNDTIVISTGTYLENPEINKPLTLASNYLFSNDPSDIENTIIDGNQMGSVFSATEIQNDTLRFIGLTVTNGNGTLCDPQGIGIDQLHGGGFYIKDVGSIVLDNMIIKENQIPTNNNSAGGVFCQNSSLWIRNSKVNDNHVMGESALGEGAGLYFFESEARISDCEITGNISPMGYSQGGGIYALNSALEIFYSSISNNESNNGGAMHLTDTDVEIHHCSINNNLARITGGIEVYDFEDHYFIMTNTSVKGNEGTGNIGAIMLYTTTAEIYNCEINENMSGDDAGAFACAGSDVSIYDSEISHNEASSQSGSSGAGMSAYLCELYLKNVVLNENICSAPNSFSKGGALEINQTELLMDSVVISNNSAPKGAAIYGINSNIRMQHTLIYGNHAQKGGAIYSFGSNIEVISSTIVDNSASTGAGIHTNNNHLIFVNSILWNNSPSEIYFHYVNTNDTTHCDFAFSDVRGHESFFSNTASAIITWHEGNLDTDPQFVDAGSGDYNLINESPLVDAGTDFFEIDDVIIVSYSPEEYVGTAPDMGAFENQSSTIFLNEFSEAGVSVWPNPFTDWITISKNGASYSEYDLINSTGKLLMHGTHPSDTRLKLNTNKLKPGVYFLRIHSADQLTVKKIVKF